MADSSAGSRPGSELTAHIREVIENALGEAFGIRVSLNGTVPSVLTNEFVAALARQVSTQVDGAAEHGTLAGMRVPGEEPHPRNRLNDLTGAEWLWSTKSVLRTSYPSVLGHNLRKHQGGNKPPQLMEDLIAFFTKRGERVLDPFGGAGGTALGAHMAGRDSVSIEINPESIAIYQAVCRQELIAPHAFIEGDCRTVLRTFAPDSFDFIATDPPYSPELEKTMSTAPANQRHGRANRRSSYVSYSDDPRDLSRCADFDAFFDALADVGRELLRVLKPRRYMAMILRDAYQNGEYIPTSAIVAQRLNEIGWTLKGEKIWYNTGARIRPYGYPSAFVPNIIHQNILILRKE